MLNYSTIIADDVRYEVGNKTTIVGIYSDTLRPSGYPVHIPKLCFLLKMEGNGVLPDEIKFSVSFSGDDAPSAEMKVSLDRSETDMEGYFSSILPALFVGADIDSDQEILLQAHADSELVYERKFYIKLENGDVGISDD